MFQESATFIQVFFDLALWILIFFSLRNSYNSPYRVPATSRYISILLIVLFCLFAFWGGDYFHYEAAFDEYNSSGYMNQEAVYEWFYGTFHSSYTLLRLAIWGLALTVLFLAYHRLSPSFDLSLFVFGSCFLTIFSYARASLAMAIIILGLSFIVCHNAHRRFISILVGFLLLGAACFFHKSAPIGIMMAIASLFLANANKRRLVLVAVFAPLLVFALQYAFDFFAVMDLDSDSFISEHYRDRFIQLEDSNSGHIAIGPFLNSFFTSFPVYSIAVLYISIVWDNSLKELSIGERTVASYAFCITLLSILFSFDFGYSTRVLQYRTLYFSMPAYAVFLAGVRRCNLKPTLFKYVFRFAVFGCFYQLVYATYCTLA